MNEKQRALRLARQQAAASITWPEGTLLLTNPAPAAQKKLAKIAIALGLAFAIGSCLSTPFDHWARSLDNDKLRPEMEAALKAGNLTAGAWLATHYHKDYPGLLQTEAVVGEPTAMFVWGRFLMLSSESRIKEEEPSLALPQARAQGRELVRKAAGAGNQDALQFAIRHGIL